MTAPKRRAVAPPPETEMSLLRQLLELMQKQIDKLDARIDGHETRCDAREATATTMRHDLRDKMQAGFAEIHNRISGINHRIIAGLVGLVLILLGAFGWSFAELLDARTLPSAQTLPIPPSPGQVQ